MVVVRAFLGNDVTYLFFAEAFESLETTIYYKHKQLKGLIILIFYIS